VLNNDAAPATAAFEIAMERHRDRLESLIAESVILRG
jgi:hypothetical protein